MKRLLSLILSVFLLFSLTGCSGKADMDFTVTLPRNISTLDPQTASSTSESLVIGSIFEGLCRVDETGCAVPGVADRWSHNDDFTEFTFHLRSARWSDGRSVTAQDFIFGITRGLQPSTGTPSPGDLFPIKSARAFYNGEATEDQLGLFAKNDRTLIITLESGYPDFPVLTAGNHYMPCNQEYFEESAGHYGLSAGYLLTNGPFTFPSSYAWNTDYNEKSVSLVRANEYRGAQKVLPATLTYLIDYSSSIDTDPVSALLSGEVDIFQLSENEARAAEEQGCRILPLEDGVTGLLLNPEAEPLKYVQLRELFLKTLDRAALLSAFGTDQEANGIMSDCVLWEEEPYYSGSEERYILQDEEASSSIPSLLSMLELKNVPSITVLCPDDERSVALANSILVSWNSQLGNAFNILPLSESEIRYRVASGNYEAAIYTLRSGGSTPYHVLKAFSSSASPQLLNNLDYDGALFSSQFSIENFQNLELSIQSNCVFYPIFKQRTYYGLNPLVSDVKASPDLRIDFSGAKKKKG